MKLLYRIIFLGLALAGLGLPAFGQLYQENYRPQYHFSPEKNWINDPCGMVYLDGEYHLMYQYNPYGNQWGNMSWGHAVSKDMVHWEELPVALLPDQLGAIFSGGAVIDHHNTAGFGDSAMVAIYTSAGAQQTQSIAYSLNKGRSWQKYEGNPVLPNQGTPDFRDPMVFWHAETQKWIQVLAVLDRIEFYSSPNLKEWTFESEFGRETGAHGGVWECPDLFPLKVEGSEEYQWVLMVSINPGSPSGGSGTQYFLGHFDGSAFTLTEEFDALINSDKILPDGVLFEDFEGEDYGSWEVIGNAFGSRPAQGTLPDQQRVLGYLGEQLVNSYLNGDASQGKLTSPHFTIEHDYINFLIGGGHHPGRAEIRLLIDGEQVAAATGSNEERLLWNAWNVQQYLGAEARIEIVDSVTGGWGHINIDHVYFSNDSIENDQLEALWTDYGPDFYAGRSWENQPTEDYQRVWLAWMSNWSYAGDIPTSPWRGSMSLPRYMELRTLEDGQVRLFQNPIRELEALRTDAVSYESLDIEPLNERLGMDEVKGTRYEMRFTIRPGASDKSGVEVRRSSSARTIIGYDKSLHAVYVDRRLSGRNFSGAYDKVFYAPLEREYDELQFRVFVDESSVEVFVNEGEAVLTARIFPLATADGIAFFGLDEVVVESFDFWTMDSIWPQEEPVLSVKEERVKEPIELYPNPSRGVFRIDSRDDIATIAVFDLNGRQLPARLKQDADHANISMEGQYRAGLYFLKIYFNNGQVTEKKLLLN